MWNASKVVHKPNGQGIYLFGELFSWFQEEKVLWKCMQIHGLQVRKTLNPHEIVNTEICSNYGVGYVDNLVFVTTFREFDQYEPFVN